jgi:hypothetical protein
MFACEDLPDRRKLKYGTDRNERYLVDTSMKIVGKASWMSLGYLDPDITPQQRLPNRVFTKCGEVIANNLAEASLIPHHILHFFEDVSPVLDDEIVPREPLAKFNPEVKEGHERHIRFNNVLKDILRMFRLALRKPSLPKLPIIVAKVRHEQQSWMPM